MEILKNKLKNLKIVPVVKIEDSSKADFLADALIEACLPCVEVTLRTPAGLEAIKTLAKNKNMLVGAGTILTKDQVEAAGDAGADFLVSPGTNPKVIQHSINLNMPIIPGISNPTDIETAMEFGLTSLKFFPAEAFGGIKTLKALSAPYSMIDFMPTGGISLTNIKEYLAHDKVIACGGSWMVQNDWVKEGSFDKITKAAKEAVEFVKDL